MSLEPVKAATPPTGIPRKPLPVDRAFPSRAKAEKKKSRLPFLLGILALLLIGGSAYLLYVYLPSVYNELSIAEQSKKVQVKRSDWDTVIFQNPIFLSLEKGVRPSLDGSVGGGNPTPFARRLK